MAVCRCRIPNDLAQKHAHRERLAIIISEGEISTDRTELTKMMPAAPSLLAVALVGWSATPPSRPALGAPARSVNALVANANQPPLRGVEVLPPLLDAQVRPGLSDDSVARIFELVFRDTRKVLSEYRFGDIGRTIANLAAKRDMGYYPSNASDTPQPVIAELIRDRLPMLQLYAKMRWEKTMIDMVDFVDFINLSPRGAADLKRTRALYERRLDYRRSMLWPTLRKLLLTSSMHRRLVVAAQMQVALEASTSGRSLSPAKAIMRSPSRLVKLWLGALRAFTYGLRWILNEFGMRWVLSPRQRQRVRVELIERAIVKGLELQRRVERIEQDAKDAASVSLSLITPRTDWLGGPFDQIGVQKAALALARWRQQMWGPINGTSIYDKPDTPQESPS